MEGAENIMSEERKSKAELLQELNALRQRICELEQANQAHQKFERQFKELFENTPVGIYRTTPDGRIIMANPALIQMLGYSSFEELSQRDLEKEGFAPDYIRSEFKDLIEKEGKVVGLESAWIRRDGTLLFIIENARAVRDESGKILYYEGIVQDVTERKKTEEATQQIEGRFRLMAENSLDYIFQTTIDGTTIYCSPAIERILGYAPEDRQGQNFTSVILPSDLPKAQALFKEAIKGKSHQNIELNLVHKSGRTVSIEVSVAPIFENNKVNSIFGIVRNITNRKKAEQDLQVKTAILQNIISNIPYYIFWKDKNSIYLGCNYNFAKLAGLEKVEDVIGKTDYDLPWKKEESDSYKKIDKEVMSKGAPILNIEEPVHHGKGNVATILTSKVPLRNTDGEITSVLGIFTDITERKKAEQKLRASEDKNRTLLENLPQKIFLKDRNSVYISCNENYARDLNIKPEEIVGKTDYDFLPKELAEKYRVDDKKVIESGRTQTIEEKYIQDGQEIFVHTVKTPVKDEQGNIIGVLGIFWDITDRKKMEEALRESQRWQRAILDSIPDMAWLKDKKSRYIAANEALCKAFGIKSEDFVGKTDLDISPKDLAEKYRTDDQEVIKSGKRRRIEEQWGKKQDERIWIETIKTPIYNYQGQIIGTSGIARDVTERKKLERALIESELRYRTLFDTSPVGVGLASLDGKVLAFNNALLSMTGYSEAEIQQINLKDTYVDPQERAKLLEKLRTNDVVRNYDVRLKRKNGTIYWASLTISMFEQAGQDVLLTVAVDITERKKAEEKIRTLISAIEQSIDGIAITDMEPKLLYVNEAFARMHDYTPEEMIGMPVARLHSKEQMEKIIGDMHQVQTRGSKEGEIEHIKKDGTSFPTYMSITLLKDNDGGPSGMLAVARDITESKQREEELNDYRQKTARSERLASLGTLSAGLAHELNQPLTVITLSIENLLADMETIQHPGTIVDRLRDVLNEVSKVTSITRRFRDAARRSLERIYNQVDLKCVVEKTLKLFDERAQRAKITLVLKGFDKLPFIYSSEEEMGQLFFALVENAIQAADGRKNRRLVISGAVKDQHIVLQFSDNCGGIEPEHLDRIFEPFFSTKLAGEATGLGLCIVEHVVSRAGGKVHVESKRGKGTTFYITLPVKGGTKFQ